jgi:predicted aldo/keto reductase-like oxidoreductase
MSRRSMIGRRQFLAGASMALGSVALGGRQVLAEPGAVASPAPARPTSGTDVVTLGNTGIKTSVLGIGTGTRGGREQREMGEEAFVKMTREAFDRGIRYIDTADTYRMHGFVAAAVKELPREKLFIQTKTRAKDAKTAKADVERFRRELGLETLDTVLIHCMTRDDWPEPMDPVIDALLEAKRKGRVRAIGVSCHTLDALVDAADCPEMEAHLVRINPAGAKMDGPPPQVAAQIERMHRKGRGVIGMKVYGENGFENREARLKSLRYVLGLGTVHAFTIGFSSVAQIDETLELICEATADEQATRRAPGLPQRELLPA